MKLYRGGFTIVESMIFLTISAVMFIGVIASFQGTQKSTQFSQSVREFESSLNDILNDTASGVFPQITDQHCFYSGLSTTPSFSPDAGAKSGDNNNCIYLGKAIQLGDGADKDSYIVHTIIANNDNLSSEVFFGDSAAVYNNMGISTLSSGSFDTAEVNKINWGTEIKHTYLTDGGGTINYVWALGAFYNQFGSNAGAAGFNNGIARISLTAITADGTLAQAPGNAITTSNAFKTNIHDINSLDYDQDYKGVISICLEGGDNEQAVIDVGRSDGGLNAVAVFEERPECA